MIPSYDDLTPGIPDVLDSASVRPANPTLFACLRQTASGKQPTADGQRPTVNNERPTANGQRPTLLTVARDFSPRVMVVSEREVLLDVSGLGRLIGEPPAVAAALSRAVYDAGLEASVALAPTQTAARVLATQSPDCPMTQWPYLPVTLLQPLETVPPGMNHRDRARPYETFERWGIVTLGDLVALPAADLSSRFGRRGVALQRLARGLDPRPFVSDGDTPRYIGRLELEWPLDSLEPLSFVFARLLEPLSAALERADRGAAAIRLDLRLTTRDTHTRLLQLAAPMRDARVLRTLLLLDLESGPPSAAVDVVSIELDPAPARITQFSLLERAVPSPETLSTLTARLSALVGESRVGSAVLLDTYQPGAFEMTPYAPVNGGACSGTPITSDPNVGPMAGSVLRRQRTPPAIRVSVEHGRPVYIAASKRTMPQGAVTQAAGPWRTSGGWWNRSGAEGRGLGHGTGESGLVTPKPRSGERGWNRDEWDVALTSGAVCRIYQDRTTGRWFLEGTYD
jgi:protein ImuB